MTTMHAVTSREYKVMLEHRWFEDRKNAVKNFWEELSSFATANSIGVAGEFGSPEKRTITFFDTSDHLLRRSGLVFRRRVEKDEELQFTLKARNEDRYISDGFDLEVDHAWKSKEKFEEDIAPPFRSRFSHSTTVEFGNESDSPFASTPAKICDIASLFSVIKSLKRGDDKVSSQTTVVRVNGITACERVYKGPLLALDDSESASVALILWSNGWNGRPLLAEFSFRYKNKNENFSSTTAKSARRFFEMIQTGDWCRPATTTKTQYVYREQPSR